MASQSRKYRGFSTERVVAKYLSTWWPHADIGRGAGKDITHVPYDMEVKARSAFQPKAWIDQVTKRAGKAGDLPIVVARLNGQGEKSPEDYLAFMRLGDLVDLLLKAGYGDLQDDVAKLEPERCNQCGSWKFKNCPCGTCSLCGKKGK
ncbi:hypothetical protein UFOVP538_8 [uncultured Caudovirales phage]|uniref:Uncharacterized protein n=1 Tax=uncultured Caudovirales phage TaxID=2100421 RepID=A0A6J5MR45_9CAUD|nr:hypothetical protein UFOVP538_8 [uncultured Caudovirales phage]